MQSQDPQQQAERKPLLLAAILAGLATLGPFCIDAYMPSFPGTARSLDADVSAVQQTLSAYMVPFGFMMPFHGVCGARPMLCALDLFPDNRGLAASLQAAQQSLFCAIVAGLLSPLVYASAPALASGLGILALFGAARWTGYTHIMDHERPV